MDDNQNPYEEDNQSPLSKKSGKSAKKKQISNETINKQNKSPPKMRGIGIITDSTDRKGEQFQVKHITHFDIEEATSIANGIIN